MHTKANIGVLPKRACFRVLERNNQVRFIFILLVVNPVLTTTDHRTSRTSDHISAMLDTMKKLHPTAICMLPQKYLRCRRIPGVIWTFQNPVAEVKCTSIFTKYYME